MKLAVGLRVLLVEDEMLVGMMLEDFLCELACVVIGPATTLDTALAHARDAQFDVALLDVNLSGDDAYPVAQILAERNVAFVFVTGYQPAHGDSRFNQRPILQKPVDKAALELVLAELDPRQRQG